MGGDPAELEVYGWAAWSPQAAVLVLRNPNDKPQSIVIDVSEAFQLPAGAPHVYRARSPWKKDASVPPLVLRMGEPHTFTLQPFQVLTLDATPQ